VASSVKSQFLNFTLTWSEFLSSSINCDLFVLAEWWKPQDTKRSFQISYCVGLVCAVWPQGSGFPEQPSLCREAKTR